MSASFNLNEEIKNIRRAVAKGPGIALDRVIGYGSYFWGNHTENSDIDLAVIIARRDGECCSEKTKWTIRNFIDVSDCEHLVEDLFEIESVRTVTTCMQGKILARGVTLYANPRTTRLRKQAASQSLPYREAKEKIIEERRRIAARMLRSAKHGMKEVDEFPDQSELVMGTLSKEVVSNAQAAVVFFLWATLFANDIDPSPKAIRWNAERLIAIAAMFNPELESKMEVARTFPTERIFNTGQDGFTQQDAIRALQAASEICGVLA